MSSTHHTSLIARLFRCIGWRAIWVCLFISLWRVPVPCLHDHDTVINDRGIQQHLIQYHCDEMQRGVFGWHIHFVSLHEVLRGGGYPLSDSGDEESPDEMPVVPSLQSAPSAIQVDELFHQAEFDIVPSISHELFANGTIWRTLECSKFATPNRQRLPLLCIARC